MTPSSSAAALSSVMVAAERLERARVEAEAKAIADLAPDVAGELAALGPDLAELLGVCSAKRWPDLRGVLLARARTR